MISAHLFKNGIITVGGYMIKIFVTLSDNGFPNKELYQHGITKQDYSLQLPEFKRTPAKLPQTWSKEEIEQILAAIDTENPTGKRNYAMFLLMARTGLRISDVVSLRFSNIDWKNSTVSI